MSTTLRPGTLSLCPKKRSKSAAVTGRDYAIGATGFVRSFGSGVYPSVTKVIHDANEDDRARV